MDKAAGVGLILTIMAVPTLIVVGGLFFLCQSTGIPPVTAAVGLVNLLPGNGPLHLVALLTRPLAVVGYGLALFA